MTSRGDRDIFGGAQIQDSHARVAESFPKQGIWTGNQQLGAVLLNPQQEIQSLGSAVPKVVLVPIATNAMLLKMDEWWFPHTWSLSLWAKLTGVLPDDGGASLTTEAIINFGVGGAMQTVEVDFVRGVVLTLVANSISVRITRATRESEIFAQLALGTRGQCGCPQKHLFTNLEIGGGGGTSAVFPIPSFASNLVIGAGTLGSIVDPLVFIEQIDVLGAPTVIQSVPLSVVTGNYGGKVPILSDALRMRVRNTSAGPIRLNCHAELGL
jgi:hypothetical protein